MSSSSNPSKDGQGNRKPFVTTSARHEDTSSTGQRKGSPRSQHSKHSAPRSRSSSSHTQPNSSAHVVATTPSTSTETVKCSICGAIYSTQTHLDNHRIMIHAPQVFECHVRPCKKRYSHMAGLRKHIRAIHGPQHKFPCKVSPCTATFASFQELRYHKRNEHSPGG